MASCGEALVKLLEGYGVDTVFGIPGNHTVQLYRGLAASSIRHVSPRHEQGAAFMADGYARASGKVGVCFLISGPGLTNAATGMIQALADSVPMLVITAVAARRDLGMGEGRLHELPDQGALASQCSRFSHTLMDPRDLPKVLARAFAVFASERPGPVHIELPLDVITADASDLDTSPWPQPAAPGPDPAAVTAAAEMLTAARQPVIMLGGGTVDAGIEARALAEVLDAPVCNTVNAKGVLPASHPLAVGSSPSLGPVREALVAADVVLAVGTEWAETDYDMLFLGAIERQGQLIRVDIDAAQLARNQRPALAVASDAGLFMAALANELEPAERGGVMRAAAIREAVQQQAHYHSEMQALFDCIRNAVPELLLVGDSTLPTYYAVWQYECETPRRYFHSATGGGTLGYAIPASLGAKLAMPELPVAALIGDGSTQFTLTELAAGVEVGLPVAVLVWNNRGYREIRQGMVAAEVEPVGVDIFTPDLVAAATALGCHTARPKDLDRLADCLKQAVRQDRPTLIELSQEDFLTTPAGEWYGP
ncbi:MAG: 5-guanidino-2-oxopentanoate decarboxylase [Halieaceae bacterium]|nr:5-guanidino-2-oxopentanoate decarboxylase [Halieaceae bacterium]